MKPSRSRRPIRDKPRSCLGLMPSRPFADFVDRRHVRDPSARTLSSARISASRTGLRAPQSSAGLEHPGNNSYHSGLMFGVWMLTHAQVWSAIDRLAARAGLSASGLARRAGLDPTTFNKSKRITPQGRARWPSTESIAKALAATGTPFDTFVGLIEPAAAPRAARGAAARLRRGRRRRLFRRWRLSGRRRLGRNRLPGRQRRARLRARSLRPVDGAGLSRRRHHSGVAGGADPPRRPRRGADAWRRGDGERTQAQDRQIDRAEIAQCPARRPHAAGRRGALDRPYRCGRANNHAERASAPSIMATVLPTP